FYRVMWLSHNVPGSLSANQFYYVNVALKNRGGSRWWHPCCVPPGGGEQDDVALGYAWDSDDYTAFDAHGRYYLPYQWIPPEYEFTVYSIQLNTYGLSPGWHTLLFDLVHEYHTWFRWRPVPG